MNLLRIGLFWLAVAMPWSVACGSGDSGSVPRPRSFADTTAASASSQQTPTPAGSPAVTAKAALAPTGCPSAIPWSDAVDHVGEQATVRGPVKGANYATSTKGKPTFLDVGKAYPDPARFTVLIWGDDRGNFPAPPEKAYAGKMICVTGLVTSYKGGAEIEVSSAAAIVVE